MPYEKDIDQYFQLIADTQVEALSLINYFHTRIILLALLDVLSRAAYPEIDSNRDRFTDLIDNYANWELSKYYCLRQLSMLLEEPDALHLQPEIERLRGEIATRMGKFPIPGSLVYAKEVDPSASELQPFLTEKTIQYIDRVRYPRLLWALRNSVMHELRNLGRGADFKLGKGSPYYHIVSVDSISKTWELYVPNDLLTNLLNNASLNLKQHFIENNRNPWDAFPYNPKWY